MCRQEIASDYFDNPDLLDVPFKESIKESEDEYQWFYEGRNGNFFNYYYSILT